MSKPRDTSQRKIQYNGGKKCSISTKSMTKKEQGHNGGTVRKAKKSRGGDRG